MKKKNNEIINERVSEALKDAKDSSDEEESKKNKNTKKLKDIINFSGDRTMTEKLSNYAE